MSHLSSWSLVTVGVSDLDEACALWVEQFGFQQTNRDCGDHAAIADILGVDQGAIARRTILATPGQGSGRLRLVEFTNPGAAVRENAQVYDHCAKNLDIYVADMPQRMVDLREAGYVFRNDAYSEVDAPSGVTFREIHMPAHDCINVVLLEIPGVELPMSSRKYGGVGPLITIVPDAAREKSVYRDLLGLECVSENVLDGPEVEKMVGLPPGAALDISIWGQAGEHMGQIEVIEYRGVKGNNLYPRSKAPATGLLFVSYVTDDIDSLRQRIKSSGVPYANRLSPDPDLGGGAAISLTTPAGFRIDLQAQP